MLLPSKPKRVREDKDKSSLWFSTTHNKRCWASTHSHLQELKSDQTPRKFETVGSLHFSDLWGCPDHPQNASNLPFHQSVQKILRPPHGQCFKIGTVALKSYVLPSKTDYYKRISTDSPAKKTHLWWPQLHILLTNKLEQYTMWTCWIQQTWISSFCSAALAFVKTFPFTIKSKNHRSLRCGTMQLVLGVIDVNAATCRGRFHGRSFWSALDIPGHPYTLEPAVDGQGMCHGDRCGTVTGTSAGESFWVKVQKSLRFLHIYIYI